MSTFFVNLTKLFLQTGLPETVIHGLFREQDFSLRVFSDRGIVRCCREDNHSLKFIRKGAINGMDLWHILGLAMILYVIVFSIVDSYRHRTADAPGREPVTGPLASTPQTRKAESLTRDRIELMKKLNLTHLLLNDYRFTQRITSKDMDSPEKIQTKLDEMLQEMCRYLDLPPVFSVEITPDEDMSISPDRGAECCFARRKINMFLRSYYTPDHYMIMLCHECAHYFCNYYHMDETRDFMLNEMYTDIVTCLTGFSKYMLFPDCRHYLTYEQLEAVRWTLLQERKSLSAGRTAQTH